MTLTLEETAHIYLCIAVVSDVTPPAGFRGVTLTIVTRTSSSQSSNVHFSFICAGAVSNILRVSESVLCNHANKHGSGCPLGTRCPPPASQQGSLWATAVSGQTNHQNPLSFKQWRGVRRQKHFSISPKLCFVCIGHVDRQNLVNSHSQTPQTPGDLIDVYSGSKTQRWSSHLPQLLCPACDPQGLTDNCCAAMHVKQWVLGTGFINVLSLSDVRDFFWWLFWPQDFCFSPP